MFLPANYLKPVSLDKYEQNNNFAQLGIKELGGQLNIGATYGSGTIPKEATEQYNEAMESKKEMKAEFEVEIDVIKEESNEKKEDS